MRLTDLDKCDRKLFYKQAGGWDSLITAKAAFDMLDSLPVEELPVFKWIPVSERLPKENGRYLCTVGTDYRNPREMYYEPKGKNNRTWASLDRTYVEDCFVIAWMPLPPCYEPQESEG